MGKTYAELVGFFLIVAGLLGLVVAAALVSTALAVAVGSLLALFVGGSVVYVSNLLAAREKAKS